MSAKEYNINQENKLSVGDILRDGLSKFVVTKLIYSPNQHSQYAEYVEVECLAGAYKGQITTVSHELAKEYK